MYGFGKALDVLRDGDAVRRHSWNQEVFSGRDCLILVPGSVVTVDANRPLGRALPGQVDNELAYAAHIDLVHVAGDMVFVYPWAPTHGDLLAEDWETVP